MRFALGVPEKGRPPLNFLSLLLLFFALPPPEEPRGQLLLRLPDFLRDFLDDFWGDRFELAEVLLLLPELLLLITAREVYVFGILIWALLSAFTKRSSKLWIDPLFHRTTFARFTFSCWGICA